MISERLKKNLIYYLLTGIVLGVVVIAVVLIGKYEENLAQSIDSFERIRMNSIRMSKATEEKERIIRDIKELLPARYHSTSNEELLLSAIDSIKANIRGCDITIANIEKKGGELTLPVSIRISSDSYGMLVDRVGFLQGLTYPHFRVESILIERSEEMGGLICKISGAFTIPAEKVEGERHNG